jgi:hypothetical protein
MLKHLFTRIYFCDGEPNPQDRCCASVADTCERNGCERRCTSSTSASRKDRRPVRDAVLRAVVRLGRQRCSQIPRFGATATCRLAVATCPLSGNGELVLGDRDGRKADLLGPILAVRAACAQSRASAQMPAALTQRLGRGRRPCDNGRGLVRLAWSPDPEGGHAPFPVQS